MNQGNDAQGQRRYSPLGQLVLSRLREFYREPEVLFWVYGFPILMVVALGIAFRNKPVESVAVAIQTEPSNSSAVAWVEKALQDKGKFKVEVNDPAACALRLKTGKTDVVVVPGTGDPPACTFRFDPTRRESVLARGTVDDALQLAAGRKSPLPTVDQEVDEPGGRYIDFLVPGLVGMSILGGGLWGVGFVIVDMRIRKVLKRFLATPMRRSHFLLGILLSRMIFLVPEVLLVYLIGWLAFGVAIQGSVFAVAVLVLLGSLTFSGIGLLLASRAQTVETVSGLMNLVMLPMWVLSGIFFSPERFPDAAQPFIRSLPLTPLIESLRNVSLEGASLASQWQQLAILIAYAAGTFFLALRWFRWN